MMMRGLWCGRGREREREWGNEWTSGRKRQTIGAIVHNVIKSAVNTRYDTTRDVGRDRRANEILGEGEGGAIHTGRTWASQRGTSTKQQAFMLSSIDYPCIQVLRMHPNRIFQRTAIASYSNSPHHCPHTLDITLLSNHSPSLLFLEEEALFQTPQAKPSQARGGLYLYETNPPYSKPLFEVPHPKSLLPPFFLLSEILSLHVSRVAERVLRKSSCCFFERVFLLLNGL